MTRWLILGLGLALTSGCALFSGGDEPPRPPLPAVDPELAVDDVWRQSAGSGFADQALGLAPVQVAGHLVTADPAGQVTAFDPENGQRLWRTQLDLPLSGGPGGADGTVLVGTREGMVIALAVESGEPLWEVQLSGEILAAPQIAGGIAVVHASNGKIFGLDAATGERLWTYEQALPALTLRGLSAPVLDRERVYVGMAGGSVMALVASDGRPLWEAPVAVPAGRSELERMVDVDGTPVVADGVLYAVTYQGRAAAISVQRGQILWARDLSATEGPALDRQDVYISDATGVVWSLSRRSGASLWRQDALQGRRLTAPVIHGNALAVGDDEGHVHWLARTDGRLLAREQVGSAIVSPPLVVGNVLYVLSENGRLTALQTEPR